jgi:hypothetical protein
MTASDLSSSLNDWIHFAEFGCVIVIVGILGESVDLIAKLGKRKDFRKWFDGRLNIRLLTPFVKLTIPDKLWIEGISIILVAAGLLIEVVASHEVYAISDLQNAKIKQEAGEAMARASHSESNSAQVLLQVAGLNKEAADARLTAGNAEKEAGQANARAAKFDADRAMIAKEAEEIRSTNFTLSIELQKMTQDRTITASQRLAFVNFFKSIPKKSLWVVTASRSGESGRFANKIRALLDAAGYATTSLTPPIDGMAYGSGIVEGGGGLTSEISSDIEIWVDDSDFNLPSFQTSLENMLYFAFGEIPNISVSVIQAKGLGAGKSFVFVSPKQGF